MKGKKQSLNPWIPVREGHLADNLDKHAKYLKRQSEKMSSTNERKVCSTDEFEWEIYEPATINLTRQSKYSGLHNAIHESSTYEPHFLNHFAPADCRRKYDFLSHLSFPCKVARFSYTSTRIHVSPFCIEVKSR